MRKKTKLTILFLILMIISAINLKALEPEALYQVEWSKNIGGTSYTKFNSVIAVSDGYIAVGMSGGTNSGWWGHNGDDDAIIVKQQ